eukprot:78004-Pyramimonas_sp.AAC.1
MVDDLLDVASPLAKAASAAALDTQHDASAFADATPSRAAGSRAERDPANGHASPRQTSKTTAHHFSIVIDSPRPHYL